MKSSVARMIAVCALLTFFLGASALDKEEGIGCYYHGSHESVLRYKGKQNVAEDGKKCFQWSKRAEQLTSALPNAKHNYCRAPKSTDSRPWCYTSATMDGAYWSYCNIPDCNVGPHCADVGNKTSTQAYRGPVNHATDGSACVPWNSPGFAISNPEIKHNQCRDPQGLGKLWCYTKGKKSDLLLHQKDCEVPKCVYDVRFVNSQYYMDGTEANFEDARRICLTKGMDIATIESKAENDLLQSKLNMWKPYIGLNYLRINKGLYEWSNNLCKPNFTNWVKEEPRDTGDKRCVRMVRKGVPGEIHKGDKGAQWENVNCAEKSQFICEKNTASKCRPACVLDNDIEVAKAYQGTINKSIHGRDCLPWNTTGLDYTDAKIDHNYCRVPQKGWRKKPWCYVLNDKKKHTEEFCDVPICSPKIGEENKGPVKKDCQGLHAKCFKDPFRRKLCCGGLVCRVKNNWEKKYGGSCKNP